MKQIALIILILFAGQVFTQNKSLPNRIKEVENNLICLLYTSDAADE